MSLANLAIRNCVCRALLEAKTLAGERIADSELSPIEDLIKEQRTPIVVVSIDGGESGDERALNGASSRLSLIIEIALAARVEIDGGEGEKIAIHPADGGGEDILNLLWYEIIMALSSPSGGAWSDLLRMFDLASDQAIRERCKWVRGGDTEHGLELASRTYRIEVAPIDDPLVSRDLDVAPWSRLLALFDGVTDLAPTGRAIRKLVSRNDGLADWRRDQARLGVDDDVIRDLGVAPPYETPENPTIVSDISIGGAP